MPSKKSSPPIEAVLGDPEVLEDIEALVTAGCNPEELRSSLELAFYADGSWENLVGMSLKIYKRNIREIEDCASLIERLNQSELLHRFSIAYPNPEFGGIHRSPTLPEQLREYAAKLRRAPRFLGPKRKVGLHVWKAWIVAMVIEDTGKPHDPEVAALIAAVLDNPEYNGQAHQAWRGRYRGVIKSMRNNLLNHRAGRLPAPPSVSTRKA